MKDKFLRVEEQSYLFNNLDMQYLELESDFTKVKEYVDLIFNKLNINYYDNILLFQQISEIIKNSIKHGNKLKISNKIYVWIGLTDNNFRLIVEDQGDGFNKLEKWNNFQKKRLDALNKNDLNEIEKYILWRDEASDIDDGGNSLFAAVEFWDDIVYNSKKNKIAVIKKL